LVDSDSGSAFDRQQGENDDPSTISRTAQAMRLMLGATDSNVTAKSITQRFPDSERGEMKGRAAFHDQFGDQGDFDADVDVPRSFRDLEQMSKSPTKARTSAFAKTPGGRVGGPVIPTPPESPPPLPSPNSTKKQSTFKKILGFANKKG
jgi:hypothetical protein